MKFVEKTPEGYVKQAIMEFLAAKHIYCLRINSGQHIIRDENNGKKRVIRLAPKGTADLLALVPLRTMQRQPYFFPLWIETKVPGNQLTPDQEIFREQRIEDGHQHLVAHSIEDVEEYLKRL